MNELPNIVRERMKMPLAGDHPDPDLLAAFAEQALPDRERAPLLEHLARCSDCRDVLALATPPLESTARTNKDTATARKGPWFSWPVLRWGALAACVVVVGTAVLTQLSLKKHAVSSDAALQSAPAIAPQSPALRSVAPAVKADRETDRAYQSLIANSAPEAGKRSATRPEFATKDRAGLGQPALANSAPRSALTKELRDESPGSRGRVGGVVGGAAGAAIAVPSPSPADGVARKNESQDLPLNGRNVTDLKQLPQASEAVEVSAQSAMVEADSAEIAPKVEAQGRAKIAPVPPQPAAAPSRVQGQLTALSPGEAESNRRYDRYWSLHAELRWNISSDGQLQRSLDAGKTWQPVVVADKAIFRALSPNGPDIWVGGTAGLLYHSTDAGTHWTQVTPATDKATLTADIAAIAFTDRQHGKVTASNGEVWTTIDAGQTWLKQP
jgi:Photosynthesis system II assembly factor YCF48